MLWRTNSSGSKERAFDWPRGNRRVLAPTAWLTRAMAPDEIATAMASTRKVTCRLTPMAAVAGGPNGRTIQRSARPTARSSALETIRGQVRFQIRWNDWRLTGSNDKGVSSCRTPATRVRRKPGDASE